MMISNNDLTSQPNYQLAQEAAYKILNEENIKYLPISVKKIIRSMPNLHLQRYDQFARLHNCTEKEACIELQSKDGALWYNATSNEYIIFYNENKPKTRIRFTLAHELGHYFLRHNEITNETLISRYNLPPKKYVIYEKEANYFAKRFLAPMPVIDDFLSYNDYRISQNDIETIFNIGFDFSHYILEELERRQEYGIFAVKNFLTPQFDSFTFALAKTTFCDNCYTLISKKSDFCPICNKPVKHDYLNYLYLDKNWRKKIMKYETPCDLDSNGKAIICPMCGNEEIANGPICPICGTYLINKCSGCSVTSEFDDIDDIKYACLESPNGCNMLLPSNARYCTQCGCISTFFLQNILPNYTEEFKAVSDSKLKAI